MIKSLLTNKYFWLLITFTIHSNTDLQNTHTQANKIDIVIWQNDKLLFSIIHHPFHTVNNIQATACNTHTHTQTQSLVSINHESFSIWIIVLQKTTFRLSVSFFFNFSYFIYCIEYLNFISFYFYFINFFDTKNHEIS